MARKKSSISAKSPLDKMFKPSLREEEANQETKPNEKISATEKNKQTSFLLPESQIEWLDDLCFDSKKGSGRFISKSEFMRGLLSIIETGDFSLRKINSEEELKERILKGIASIK